MKNPLPFVCVDSNEVCVDVREDDRRAWDTKLGKRYLSRLLALWNENGHLNLEDVDEIDEFDVADRGIFLFFSFSYSYSSLKLIELL